MSDATHAVIVKAYIWRDGKLLLLKRCDDDDDYAGHWDTPGGHLHVGESATDGLKREVWEETGLLIEHARPISTWSYRSALGISFLAKTPQDPSGTIQLSSEHTAFEWVTPQRLASLDVADSLRQEINWLVQKGWHL